MVIRILLVDDHRVVRQALRALIERRTGMEVIAEAASGKDAIDLAAEHRPDLVIMDIGMPDVGGIEATRQIAGSTTRVIAMSMHAEKRFVSRMLRSGASGYLLKDRAFEELFTTIDEVLGGRVYLGTGVTR